MFPFRRRLDGRVILVRDAASTGAEAARRCAGAGARVVETLDAAGGRLDGVVYAADPGDSATLADSTPEQVRRAAEVNFFAAVELIRAALPALIVSADAGRRPAVVSVIRSGGGAATAGSRAALVGLTQAVHIEFARYGVAVKWVPAGRGAGAVVRALAG